MIKLSYSFLISPLHVECPTDITVFSLVSLIKQGDKNISVHLMITIWKVTSNVPSVPRQSSDIY
jgi:hypothetical protein